MFFTDTIGVTKNPITKRINSYKMDICEKDPQVPKKRGLKSEKYKFTNIFTRFVQHGQFLLKGFKLNSIS